MILVRLVLEGDLVSLYKNACAMWGVGEMVALVVTSLTIVCAKSLPLIIVCALIFWMVILCWAHIM